ncbi:MAG: Flp family type IVb pilin [Hyphomicrobiales bacterium]|nr:Flp family type IVb pilin [Hyphomicrobiales bacterium]
MSKMVRFFEQEEGATAIEYALIASATGLVLIAVLPALGSGLSATFTALVAGM